MKLFKEELTEQEQREARIGKALLVTGTMTWAVLIYIVWAVVQISKAVI